jgi:hypothetical protein
VCKCYCKSRKICKSYVLPVHPSICHSDVVKFRKEACKRFYFRVLLNHFGKCWHLLTPVGRIPFCLAVVVLCMCVCCNFQAFFKHVSLKYREGYLSCIILGNSICMYLLYRVHTSSSYVYLLNNSRKRYLGRPVRVPP